MSRQLVQIGLMGGVNLLADQRRLREDERVYEMVACKNLAPIRPGILALRPASAQIGFSAYDVYAAVIAPPATKAVAVYGSRDTVSRVTAVQGDFATEIISSSYSARAAGRVALVPYNNKVYCFAGYPMNGSGKVVQTDGVGGTEIVEFEFLGAGNGGIHPAGAVSYRRRMGFFNFGPGYESDFIMADPNDPTTIGDNLLAANSRRMTIGSGDGAGKLVGAVEVMLTGIGSPAQAALLLLKERRAYLMTGEPNLSTESLGELFEGMVISKVSVDCGCASAETIVSTPFGVIWASHDDVWLFAQGQVPQRVGTKIRPALLRSPASARYLWHAAFHDGFYRLAVIGDGQGPDDESPCQDQWWLDLRDGPPQHAGEARWFGPQQFKNNWDRNADEDEPEHGTRIMLTETRPGAEPALYGVMAMDAAVSRVVTIGPESARDMFFGSDLTDGELYGTEIEGEITTKEYDFGDPMVNKLYQGVEINAWASHPAVMEVEAHMDGGRDVDTHEGHLLQEGFIVGVGLLHGETTTEYATLAHWKHEVVTGGTIAEEEGNLYDLQVNGTAPTVIAGQDGSGFRMSAFGRLQSAAFNPGTSFHGAVRISLWVKTVLPSANYQTLIHIGDTDKWNNDAISGEIIGLYLSAAGEIQLQWDQDGLGDQVQILSSSAIASDTWTFIEATRFADGTVELSADGVVIGTGSGTPIEWTTGAAAGFMLVYGLAGSFAAVGRWFTGDVDELKVEGITEVETEVAEGTLLSRQFQSISVQPDEDARHFGKTVQLKIRNKLGYIIDENNDEVVLTRADVISIATLTQGVYDNIVDLMDHVVTRLGVAASATFTHDQVEPARSGAGLTLTLSVSSGTFAPRYFVAAGATALQLDKTKRLMALLGMDTSEDPALAASHTAESETFYVGGHLLELGAVNIDIRPMRRRT